MKPVGGVQRASEIVLPRAIRFADERTLSIVRQIGRKDRSRPGVTPEPATTVSGEPEWPLPPIGGRRRFGKLISLADLFPLNSAPCDKPPFGD